MTKMNMLKGGASLAANIGTNIIVGTAISMIPIPGAGLLKGLCVKVGSMALTGMIGDKAAQYTADTIDSVAATIKEMATEEAK